MRGAADEEGAVGDGHGGEGWTFELIGGEVFQLTPRCDDDRFAIFAQKIDAAVGVDGRGGISAIEARAPEFFTGLRVDARRDAVVSHDVQLVADKQR